MASQPLEALFSQILDLPPNCLKFCKIYPDHFVIGTYFLEEDPDAQPVEAPDEEKMEAPVVSNRQRDTDASGEQEDVGQPGQNTKASQKRSGMLMLCKLVTKAGSNGSPEVEVIIIQKVAQESAIYDLNFKKNTGILITTSTTGSLSLFELVLPGSRGHMVDDTILRVNIPTEDDKDVPKKAEINPQDAYLQYIGTYQLFPESTLVIALDYHPFNRDTFAVSLSDGNVAVVKHSYSHNNSLNDSSLEIVAQLGCFQKHTDSAWCVLWGDCYLAKWAGESPDVITANLYSGGDDCKIRYTQLMLSQHDGSIQNTSKEIQISDSGITAMARLGSTRNPQSHTDFILVGGYDNKVRILAVCTPLAESEPDESEREYCTSDPIDLGGTIHKLEVIWPEERSKYDEQSVVDVPSKTAVLASCAHIGVRLLLVTQSGKGGTLFDIQVVAKFEGHNSMNYASGVFLNEKAKFPAGSEELQKFVGKEMSLCVSTSFYDRLMCVWAFKKYW